MKSAKEHDQQHHDFRSTTGKICNNKVRNNKVFRYSEIEIITSTTGDNKVCNNKVCNEEDIQVEFITSTTCDNKVCNEEDIQVEIITSTTGDNKVCSPYLEIRPACVGLVLVISVTGSNRVSPMYQCWWCTKLMMLQKDKKNKIQKASFAPLQWSVVVISITVSNVVSPINAQVLQFEEEEK